MQSRYLVALYSGFYMMFLVVGCKPRNRSQLLEKAAVSKNQGIKIDESEVTDIQSRASDALRSLEKIGPSSLKDAMCSLSRVADSNGGNILKSIDGISFKAGANIPKLLGKGTGPIGFSAAAEYVWWFGKKDNLIEDHLFLLPQVGISKGDDHVIGTEVAIIYGCKSDAANYAGYFGSMTSLGVGLNLGVNLYPMFENYYIDGLKSSIPGGVDDNKPMSHDQAIQIITEKSSKLHSFIERQKDVSGVGNIYRFQPKMTNRTMKSILADVQFNIANNSMKPSLDELYS
ncbi:MAG: hypothetical protein NT027_03230, partial [Proteobacteria bacterium]|nr:hypothetical protein [Pseudomonadota bacterium]